MDNWEQLHINATLLKPAKHCHSLFRAHRAMKKLSGKTNLAIPVYKLAIIIIDIVKNRVAQKVKPARVLSNTYTHNTKLQNTHKIIANYATQKII